MMLARATHREQWPALDHIARWQMFPGTQFTAKQRAVNKWDTLGGSASRVLSLAFAFRAF